MLFHPLFRAPLLVLGCLAGGLIPGPVRAQLPEYIGDPLVVTATRTLTAAALTGASVEIVTGDELRSSGAVTLFEGLAHVPGLTLTRAGTAGGTGTVMMRGAKSDHLLVLIDGVAVNDPISTGNVFDFNTLPVDAIERVEIVKGPQSPLYGSDAVAGVINIITRRPEQDVSAWLRLEAGSYETLNAAAGATGRLGGTGVRLEVARRQLGGISSAAERYDNAEPDAWQMWSGALSLERPLAGGNLSAVLRGTRSRFDIDDFGGPFGDDPNALARREDLTGSLRYRSDPGRTWVTTVRAGASQILRRGRDRSDSAHPDEKVDSEYRGLVQTMEWQHELALPRHRLTAGLAWERQSGRSSYRSDSGGWAYVSLVPWCEQSVAALFLQDQITIAGAVLTAGGRIDAWSGYDVEPTWRLAVARPFGRVSVHGSIGTGFRTPSLYQRFSPDYGSADLAAERTVGWEAGAEATVSDRARITITRYRQQVTDLIDFLTDPDTWVSRYKNRSRVVMQGWECVCRAVLSVHHGLEGGITLIEARDETAGEDLIRRPDVTVTGAWHWRGAGPLSGAVRLRYVGRRTDIDFSAPPYPVIDLDPVALLEADLEWDLTEHFGLGVRLRNITDADPEWVWGYGATGRALYLACRIR